MKIKYSNKPAKRILQQEYLQMYVNEKNKEAYVGLVKVKKVTQPSIKIMEKDEVCIIADGYTWLQIYPINQNFCITVMYNEQNEIVQWYFDVIIESGLTQDNIIYMKDLYLDIVVLPNGNIHILDEDELQQALIEKDITQEQYQLAFKVKDNIVTKVKNHIKELKEYSNYYLNKVKGGNYERSN